MPAQIFHVDQSDEYRKAGPTDLIQLRAAPGGNPLFLLKWIVETLVYGIIKHEFIHLSGPTGSAKSSLIEALYLVPENFLPVCRALGQPELPLKLYPVEMAIYEAPGELYQRRALKDGTTYDELSLIVRSLQEISNVKRKCYPLVWLREMGRVHSSTVQGGLLNLMTRGDIILAEGSRIAGEGIAWVADSNYQAEHDSTHTLVTLDDALRRRFSLNLTLDYLSAEQEAMVLQHLMNGNGAADQNLILKIVKLGQVIRRHRSEGTLQTVTAPTIYGYVAFARMAKLMPHMSLQQIAIATLLGNAGQEDQKLVPGVFNEVFGLQTGDDQDRAIGGNLF